MAHLWSLQGVEDHLDDCVSESMLVTMEKEK